jgi:hypothetical protein
MGESLVRKLVAVAAGAAAIVILCSPGLGQASSDDSSCAGGSVTGRAPRTPMCFGTMFPQLPAFRYSDQAAADLAATMENPVPDAPGVDRGTADDSATLPAEYTYLGQFVDHNLDFDETAQPTADVSPTTLTNYESFRFDLGNLFGGGPLVDPQLYAADHKHLLVTGTPGKGDVYDLARDPLTGQAILVEPRDDDNQIVSQVTAAFAAFYNDFVDQGDSYAQARRLTESYYQEIVLTDLLPAYVGQGTIDDYLSFNRGGRPTLTTPNFPEASFTPVEFAVGAYRFGHALVRENYHVNDTSSEAGDIDTNLPIFDLSRFQSGDLSGGGPLPAGHQIEWRYFVPALDVDPGDPGINYARQTQPSISPALFNLPAQTIPGCSDTADSVCNGSGALISRDFARGTRVGIASGQDVARALGCRVIPAGSINRTTDAVFDRGTPLLYYVLAEAEQADRPLGCAGRRIVAETFLRVLWETPNSILRTGFRPDPRLVKLAPEAQTFSFGDLLVDTGLAPRAS